MLNLFADAAGGPILIGVFLVGLVVLAAIIGLIVLAAVLIKKAVTKKEKKDINE